jgi:hypothetical protein
MQNSNGESVLDALLFLGYHVEIADDGKITASNGSQTLQGKAEHGAIEWADRGQTYQVLHLAYLARLRKRIREANGA